VKRKLTDDLGTLGCRIFVDEYARASGLRLSGLLYYWSATLIGLLLDIAVKRHLPDDVRHARLTSYASEFAELPERVADLGHPV